MKKLFDEIPYLENERLILHAIHDEDVCYLEKMVRDPKVRKYLPTFLFEYGFKDQKETIKNIYGDIFRKKESLHLGIYEKENPEIMVGIVECYNYDPNWNKTSIGIRLDSNHWGKGIAGNAVALMMDYLLNETDVKRITAHVITDNQNSRRIFETIGFDTRKSCVPEDWGHEEAVIVNKYVYEKWGNIRYQKIGNGEKIMVILPGLALKSTLGSAEEIAKNYSMFRDYTIYLFDDREGIGPEYTIRERAGDVAAEMKMLKLKHACVYGASMGGMVGQYLAIDHPDLVKKLFIVSTASRMNEAALSITEEWKKLAENKKIPELMDSMLRNIYSEHIVNQYGTMFKESVGEVSEDERKKFIILLNAVQHVNTYDELEKIQCPVYAVCAMGDRVLSPEATMEIAGKLNCDMYEYGEEYGHAVYDEAADNHNRMLEFFEK